MVAGADASRTLHPGRRRLAQLRASSFFALLFASVFHALHCFCAPGFEASPQDLRSSKEATALAPGPQWRQVAGKSSTARSVLPPPTGSLAGNYKHQHRSREAPKPLQQLAPFVVFGGTVLLLLGVIAVSFMAPAHQCCCHHHVEHTHGIAEGILGSLQGNSFFAWMASPGRPDRQFGGLCVYSNVFFALLAPIFWLEQMIVESGLVILVVVASTVYHSFQIHPALGPLHEFTRFACVSDICLAVSLAAFLAIRHPRTRNKALPAVAGAAVCFVLPTLLPSSISEVGYSWLHSAWHGFSALAAYNSVGAPPLPLKPMRTAVMSLVARASTRSPQVLLI